MIPKFYLTVLLFFAFSIISVNLASNKNAQSSSIEMQKQNKNPFFAPSKLPFQAPPFDKIKDSDYQPAIEEGMKQQLVEIKKIAENPAPPTFENTLVALEKSGQLLSRVTLVFNAITDANTNPVLQK